MKLIAPFAILAVIGTAVTLTTGCPGDDCTRTATCPSSSGGGGAGAAGGAGSVGGSGTGTGTGGTAPSCGNGTVDAGELCFTEPAVTYETGGEDARDMVLVDCDADGDLDVVVAHFNEALLTTMRNTGAAFNELIESDTQGYPLMALDLVDLGGSFEIAGLSSSTSNRVVWFTSAPATPCGWAAAPATQPTVGVPVGLGYGDLDGNANPDTVRVVDNDTDTYGAYTVFPNHDPTVIDTEVTWGADPTALLVGDFVGSPLDDLVVAHSDQTTLTLLENQSGILSSTPIDVPGGGVADHPVAMAAGDLNADGLLDIVTANVVNGSIAVLRNLGAGGFSAQSPEPKVEEASSNPQAIALGDIDGDGDLDIATANGNGGGTGTVSIFLNDGTGTMTLASTSGFTVGQNPSAVQLADLNGDGATDIITTNAHVESGTSSISVLVAAP